MTRVEMPQVLSDELRAVYAQLDAARDAAREARRLNDRRYNVVWWCTWALIGVSMLTRSWWPHIAGVVACIGNYALWLRGDLRAREIENRASRSLWLRARILCIALDVVAPRQGFAPTGDVQ